MMPRELPGQTANGGLSFSVFFVLFVSLFAIAFTDSYEKTLEEQRKLSYGAWHIAVYDTDEHTRRAISGHAIIKSAATMELAGLVVNDDGAVVGGVGAADNDLRVIGNIMLLNGRFPLNADEIAVEASFLTQLGFSYELGQTITLPIAPPGNAQEGKLMHDTFTLCGVVKNYSAYWKSDGFPLVSFFVHPAFCANTPETRYTVFAQLYSQYANEAEALRPLAAQKGRFVKNDFTYFENTGENLPQMNLVLLQSLLIFAGCISMILSMNKDISRRQNTYITLRILGATKNQILRLFLYAKAKAVLPAAIAGILSGIIVPYCLCFLLIAVTKQPVTFYVTARHIVQTILLICSGLVAAIAFCMVRLFQLPLQGVPQQQFALQKMPKRRKPLRKNNLYSVLEAPHCGRRLLSVLLIFLSSAFVFLSAYQAWADFRSFQSYKRDYPSDYAYGMLLGYHRPKQTMTQASLSQIKAAYGVKDVCTFSVSDYYSLAFDDGYDADYAGAVYKHVAEIVPELPDSPIRGPLIGITDSLFPTYLREMEFPACSGDALPDGTAILYLPDYYVSNSGALTAVDMAFSAQKQEKILSEQTIKAGDVVKVQTADTQKSLTILGVIRTLSQNVPIDFNPGRPYSLLCNEKTYCQLADTQDYAYVLAYGDSTAIPYQTDVELSKLRTGLFFENRRIERNARAEQLALQALLAVVLNGFGFWSTFLMRLVLESSQEKQTREKYQTLFQLGMQPRTLRNHLTFRAVQDSLSGILCALFVFAGFRCLEEKSRIESFADLGSTSAPQCWINCIERCFLYTDWVFVALLTAFLLCMHLWVLWKYSKRSVRLSTLCYET